MTTSNGHNFVYRSKCKREPFSFRWEIEQFEESLPVVDEAFLSPDFKVGSGALLYLCLTRELLDGEEWCNANLTVRDVPKAVLGFSVALLRSPHTKGDYRKEVKMHHFLSSGDDDGEVYQFPKFIRYSDLVNPAEGFLKDGHLLTVLVEGSDFYGRREDEFQIELPLQESSVDLETDLCKQTCENLGKVFEEGLHSDFVVKAKDANGVEKELKVHKAILAGGSNKVFEAMLSNPDLKECRAGMVEIEDIRFEVMEALIRFLYTGKIKHISACKGIELDLLFAADKYQIDGLKTLVERCLAESLSVENVCSLLANADLLKAPHLKAQCVEFISRRRKLVVKSEGWHQLCAPEHSCLLGTLFSGDEEALHQVEKEDSMGETSSQTGNSDKRRRLQ